MTKDKLLDMALEALQFKNILNACGQYSVVDPVKASEAIIAIKRDRALDKKAENARELGLDYEPEERYTYGTPLLDAFTKPAPVQEPVAFNAGVPPLYPEMKDGETISVEYTTPPAQPAPVQEPAALPCCGYTDASAVKWNPFNGVVQCHNCGQTYAPPAAQRTWVGLGAEWANEELKEKNT